MKRALPVILCLLLYAPAWAFQETTPPEGHVESAAHDQADGKVFPFSDLILDSIYGTAHKGGASQADADSRGVVYSLYIAWDRDGSGAIDAGDEPPNANTTLTAGINNAVTTIPVADTTYFYPDGFVVVGSELIKYTGKTATSLTGCSRGYNESDPASHLSAATVTECAAFQLITSIIPGLLSWHAVGWDATFDGGDDGTEGELIQNGSTFTMTQHRSYLVKIHVVDGTGLTNTMVTGADVFHTFGAACYVGANGSAAQGLEDDEVWLLTTGSFPE